MAFKRFIQFSEIPYAEHSGDTEHRVYAEQKFQRSFDIVDNPTNVSAIIGNLKQSATFRPGLFALLLRVHVRAGNSALRTIDGEFGRRPHTGCFAAQAMFSLSLSPRLSLILYAVNFSNRAG